jgi:hypothetical protein
MRALAIVIFLALSGTIHADQPVLPARVPPPPFQFTGKPAIGAIQAIEDTYHVTITFVGPPDGLVTGVFPWQADPFLALWEVFPPPNYRVTKDIYGYHVGTATRQVPSMITVESIDSTTYESTH